MSPWLVAGGAIREVVCGWETELQRGREAAALEALDRARDWPVLSLRSLDPAFKAAAMEAAGSLRDPATDGDRGLDCP